MFLSCIASVSSCTSFQFSHCPYRVAVAQARRSNTRRPRPTKRAINPIDLPLSRRSIDPSILVRCCTQASLARARAIPPNPILTA
ncbi:hypothetical protein V8C34DRAFT_279930 [Trichoderma compactum]